MYAHIKSEIVFDVKRKFLGHTKNEIDAYFHIDYGLKYCIFMEVDDLRISGSNDFLSVLTDAVKKSSFYGAYSQPIGS